jgi:hypothetical protein
VADQLGNRRGIEYAPVRQFGIRESTLSEIRKMCGAGDDGKLPLKAKPAADQMPALAWVFNRQHNGLGNQLFEFIWYCVEARLAPTCKGPRPLLRPLSSAGRGCFRSPLAVRGRRAFSSLSAAKAPGRRSNFHPTRRMGTVSSGSFSKRPR